MNKNFHQYPHVPGINKSSFSVSHFQLCKLLLSNSCFHDEHRCKARPYGSSWSSCPCQQTSASLYLSSFHSICHFLLRLFEVNMAWFLNYMDGKCTLRTLLFYTPKQHPSHITAAASEDPGHATTLDILKQYAARSTRDGLSESVYAVPDPSYNVPVSANSPRIHSRGRNSRTLLSLCLDWHPPRGCSKPRGSALELVGPA